MFKQTSAITAVNIKSIPERWGSSLVIVVGLAGVVAVFTALLAMAEGFQSTLKAAGREDVAMVLRGGSSDSELNSALGRDAADLIRQGPGIAKDEEGKPLVSAELLVISELPRPGQKTGSNVTLRGLEPNGLKLRPQVKIVEGRAFQSGLREVLVGRGVTRQFQGANLGDVIRMRGSDWTVVGVFDSGIGGLTVLEALLTIDAFHNDTQQPGADGTPDFAQERFIYFGDQANMPYGNYSAVNRTDYLRELIVKDAIREESKKVGTTIYCDWTGSFRKAFKLAKGKSSVVLVGKDGKVLFAGEGKLSADDRKKLLALLKSQVEGS